MRETSVYLVFLFLFLHVSCEKETPTFINYQTYEIKQEFSDDWSRWIIHSVSLNGNLRTEFSQSWDRWLFFLENDFGAIRTEFNDEWDRWNINLNQINIKTEFNESWNRWLIAGNSATETITIRREFSDNNTRWLIYSSENGEIGLLKTTFAHDYRRWMLRLNADKSNLSAKEILSLLFIGVFTSSIEEQNIL
jgi:hypothetical protein